MPVTFATLTGVRCNAVHCADECALQAPSEAAVNDVLDEATVMQPRYGLQLRPRAQDELANIILPRLCPGQCPAPGSQTGNGLVTDAADDQRLQAAEHGQTSPGKRKRGAPAAEAEHEGREVPHHKQHKRDKHKKHKKSERQHKHREQRHDVHSPDRMPDAKGRQRAASPDVAQGHAHTPVAANHLPPGHLAAAGHAAEAATLPQQTAAAPEPGVSTANAVPPSWQSQTVLGDAAMSGSIRPIMGEPMEPTAPNQRPAVEAAEALEVAAAVPADPWAFDDDDDESAARAIIGDHHAAATHTAAARGMPPRQRSDAAAARSGDVVFGALQDDTWFAEFLQPLSAQAAMLSAAEYSRCFAVYQRLQHVVSGALAYMRACRDHWREAQAAGDASAEQAHAAELSADFTARSSAVQRCMQALQHLHVYLQTA